MILDIVISGLILMSVYFIVGFGITFQYGVGGFPNLALGYIGQLGVYVAIALWSKLGGPLSIITGAFVSIIFSILIQKIVINPLSKWGYDENEKRINVLYGTFALSIAIPPIYQNIFRSTMVSVPIPTGYRIVSTLNIFTLCMIILAFALFYTFRFFLKKTFFGHKIQAVTENPKLSSIMGINVPKIYLSVAAISGFCAYIGLLIWGKLYAVNLYTGGELVMYGFIVSVLGGLGNISGAFIASALIGFSYAFCNFLIGGVFVPIVIFIIFAITIIAFPRGILRSERTL